MGCPECSRLRELFSSVINKHAELRNKEIAALKAGDVVTAQTLERELDLSSEEISALRRHLLNHEATHAEKS